MNLDILNKCTTHLRNTLSRSIDIAWEMNEETIPPIFLLIALSEQVESVGAELLGERELAPKQLLAYVGGAKAARGDKGVLSPEFSSHTKTVLEHAATLANEFNHPYIGTEHLLLAVLQKPDEAIQQVFDESDTNVEHLQEQLSTIMQNTSQLGDMEAMMTTSDSGKTQPGHSHTNAKEDPMEQSETPALDYFGTDLTAQEHTVTVDPVIGRDEEIERIIHILARRNKNNPVLIGEPGVGKTAIVEGLARRIAEGDVPDILLNKRIISLDLALVLAGSMYRGEFESRFKQIIDEAKSHFDVILFIDEIHTLVGAGGVQGGTMDAANILKPALAKGEIRCIGATTLSEYRKHIEADSALDRRFQKVQVPEPTEEQAIEIVSGIREQYEQYHHVKLSDEVIEAAVRWSMRFMPDRRLPDKAIDLIDEASAGQLAKRRMPKVIKELQRQIRLLNKLRHKKELAVKNEKFNTAVNLKSKEKAMVEKIAQLEEEANALDIDTTDVTTDDIARVITTATGVPVEHITASDNTRFEKIGNVLKNTIVGQNEAVNYIASAMKRSAAGLTNVNKPLGTFMFLGPSGVGKTLLAKTLAREVFGDDHALIRVDMSEFSEGFTISKLIGAPAGYIGHNEDNKFADSIRQRPYSVVLFDEIEKAHPDIFNLLLQVLDDGVLTDATGRELNFRHSIIIMTSNIGIDMLNNQAALGFEESKAQLQKEFSEVQKTILGELNDFFPQEFLNRIDHPIVFKPLNHTEVEEIVKHEFAALRTRCVERGIQVKMMASARKFIAKASFNPEQGARRVTKMLTELVENSLADMIVSGKIKEGDAVKVSATKKGITITKEKK